MSRLLIIGAGGHGRCCLDIAREMDRFEEIAFLDDACASRYIHDSKVIGSIDELSSYYPQFDAVCVAIGNNEVRKRLMKQAKEIGYQLVILQGKHTWISPYATIGKGSVLFPGVVIENNARIGEGCILAANTVVQHDAVVEDHCLIYSNTTLRAQSYVGSMSRIGSSCVLPFNKRLPAYSDLQDGSVLDDDEEYGFEVGV